MLKESVTFFAGVPTMYWGLLNALDDVDVKTLAANLRVAVAGGAALPVEVHHQFEERFGATIEGYGLSETSPVASFSRLGQDVRVVYGTPIPGVEMKLIDPESWEEVDTDGTAGTAIKGGNIDEGHDKRPDALRYRQAIIGGWFRRATSAAKWSPTPACIVDRSKDMIIRGGFNVYPARSRRSATHPVISLGLIGVPHDSHGEEIKAFVILKLSVEATSEEIVVGGKEQTAAYKYPRIVEIVETLPMTTGRSQARAELSGSSRQRIRQRAAGFARSSLGLRGHLVLDQHLVAGRDDGADRREVTPPAGQGVADERHDHAERGADHRRRHDHGKRVLLGEDAEDQADEGGRAIAPTTACRHPPGGEAARDPLDPLEVGPDDQRVAPTGNRRGSRPGAARTRSRRTRRGTGGTPA